MLIQAQPVPDNEPKPSTEVEPAPLAPALAASTSQTGFDLDARLRSELNMQFEQAGIVGDKLHAAIEQYNDPSGEADIAKLSKSVEDLYVGDDLDFHKSVTELTSMLEEINQTSVSLSEEIQPFLNRSNPNSQPFAHVVDLLTELRNKGKLLYDGLTSAKPEDIWGSTEGTKPKAFAEPDRFQQGAHADPHADKKAEE